MKILQSVFILGVFFVAFVCLAGAGAVGKVTSPQDAPTPTPPPDSSASIVHETFAGLESLGVGVSVRRDAIAAHTSTWGGFVQDTLPLLPYCLIAFVVGAGALAVIVGLLVWQSERQAWREGDLLRRVEGLRSVVPEKPIDIEP
jgi:hypothetical protein